MCMNKKEIVGQVNMQRVDIVKAGEFKHLRSTFQSKGQYTRDEQEIPGRVEQVETYKMVVRPAMICGLKMVVTLTKS